MFKLDEKTLKKESKKNFDEFINRQRRSLITYTRDSTLMYISDEKRENFYLNPKKKTLYLPLSSFLDRELNDNEIMFHIYYELALYPDWRSFTKEYLNRDIYFKKEIDTMVLYILKKVKNENLEDDPAYNEVVISHYVKREVLNFLYTMDKYFAYLRVLQSSPLYRDEENYNNIVNYMKEFKKTKNSIIEMPKHRAFYNSFLVIELYNKIPEIDRVEENPFEKKIFNEDIFSFVRKNFIREINNSEGILIRDSFVKSFIYPIFEELWKEEIDEITLQKSTTKSSEQVEGIKNPFENIDDEMPDSLESTKDDVDKILKEMLEDEEDISSSVEDIVEGKVDLTKYGVSQSEQELFNYYSQKMRREREEMREFWRRLIGNAKKEINVKKKNQTKGKLDVDSFIEHYPDFIEAEKKGNYKNLPIFSRYLLEPNIKELPEKIEISFLIDNSGSMTKSKIEAARKALSVTLLSIEDFNQYLRQNAEKLNQRIKVETETWYFGSKYYNIKKFNYKNNREKEESDIIKSIVKIDASDGATDDASCLKEVLNSIDKKQETNLKNGKEIKIVFEITDGASSFPGRAKENIMELLDKNVKVFAFQIGKNSEKNKKIFNFVWNENHKNDHGVIIGEDVEKLPEELLKAVGNNLKEIF